MHYIHRDFREPKTRDGGLVWIHTAILVIIIILAVALVVNLWTT